MIKRLQLKAMSWYHVQTLFPEILGKKEPPDILEVAHSVDSMAEQANAAPSSEDQFLETVGRDIDRWEFERLGL